jgi:hypothetical protein
VLRTVVGPCLIDERRTEERVLPLRHCCADDSLVLITTKAVSVATNEATKRIGAILRLYNTVRTVVSSKWLLRPERGNFGPFEYVRIQGAGMGCQFIDFSEMAPSSGQDKEPSWLNALRNLYF